MENYKLFTLKELLSYCVKNHGENIAFAYQKRKKDISISYGEFKAQVEAFGTYLFNEGYKNCHVAVFGENSYEWILTHFAVTCGRNVIVPIDKDLDAKGVCELIFDSQSKVIVYSDTYADIIEQVQLELPEIVCINMKTISGNSSCT